LPKTIEDPRREILKQAKMILINKGYKELNMRTVAKECNFAIGTIYNYFRSKDDLLAQLMADYWEEYYGILEEIDQESFDLLSKLRKMYDQLELFVNTFLESWVSMNGVNYYQYSKAGLQRKEDFTEKLIIMLKSILDRENNLDSDEIKFEVTTYEISKFIILSFLMMVQMKQFEYDSFEKMIKILLKL
jgi:AcrR family transcriptional regulator